MSKLESRFRDCVMVRFAVLVAVWLLVLQAVLRAQDITASGPPTGPDAAGYRSEFRVETVPVAGGAEIVTIFARQAPASAPGAKPEELPLVSILRDTLGDERPENDRLRYVWMHTYTEPSLWQKAAAFVPFLYMRTTNKGNVGKGPPPPIADMKRSNKVLWNQILWMVFRKVVLGGARHGSALLRFAVSPERRRLPSIGGRKRSDRARPLRIGRG